MGTPAMPCTISSIQPSSPAIPWRRPRSRPRTSSTIRMQHNGSAIQYNDFLTFNIQNSYEVARCIRGRVDPDTGAEDWDHVGLNLGPWCDWTRDGVPERRRSHRRRREPRGAPPAVPRIRVTSQGYVQASLALLATCPINLLQTSGPALDGHSVDGWIEFTAFGDAADPIRRPPSGARSASISR